MEGWSSILLRNASIIIQEPGEYIYGGSVLIRHGKIERVGRIPTVETTDSAVESIIECDGLMLMPGLANCHNHLYEIVYRGLGKQFATENWQKALVYPVNKILDDEDMYHAAIVALADSIRNGTTSLVSQVTNYARFHADAEVQAFLDAGMRGRVARGVSTVSEVDVQEGGNEREEMQQLQDFITRWKHEGSLVEPWVGPAGFFSCDEDTLRSAKNLASSEGVGFHIHLNETRLQRDNARARGYDGQVSWAGEIGLLDDRTSVAHAVWSSTEELRCLREHGAHVVHNPSSNMILGSGVADIRRMMDDGTSVALGTDGPASNDSLDMISEMKAAVLLQRVHRLAPAALSAHDAFAMATLGGAAVFGQLDSLGRIAEGYTADLTGVSVSQNAALTPIYDPVESIVFCGSGRDVRLTIVGGEVLYNAGNYPRLDIAESLDHVINVCRPRVRQLLSR